ncbi:hypothetical protein QBC46DRAFT_430719 [Diplogelasinospora grovesii]|uniref:FAD-binding PCMH-type domain-containing protein n=1 Tax=Diplogelasinospora grovesii TaxID=303347 RepID=A0AAN6RZ64_9PEZI|nr:hypothetical protein QBC46DRAFT_430719 [Diplogelasinospora grovesii]
MKLITAVSTWSLAAGAGTVLSGTCKDEYAQLGAKLSSTAAIYCPGTAEFQAGSARWSVLSSPRVNVVIVPGTEGDVFETVQFANEKGLPFLAYSGAHGSITTLGRMDHGVEISLSQLSSVTIAPDGRTAEIGGGTLSKTVTDALWAAGKQTVTGTCECVSYLGPALGGGHGWLQGHYGLVADQIISYNVVLANGTLRTVTDKDDLFWGLKGAGHNFGIVTSVVSKIYGSSQKGWAIETLVFSGEKVEVIYAAANEHLTKNGTQPVDVINWSYWYNDPSTDPNGPVIAFYIIQEGVTSVDQIYTQPFRDIGPLSVQPASGTYQDLAGWTGISNSSTPCQKAGTANPRFPIYLREYNATAQKEAYELFANATRGDSAFNNSLFMFEGYSLQGVRAIASRETAFAYRGDNLLVAPLITYAPAGKTLDKEAAQIGNRLREILRKGSGKKEMHVYVNYAYGDETLENWYGSGKWRLERLAALKNRYDPQGRFSFYGPIA